MRTLLALAASLGLSACFFCQPYNPRPEPIPDEDGGNLGTPLWPDGTVSFGTTDDVGETFIPIGAEIELFRGPQGGNHLYAKYQVTRQVAPNATFEHRVRRARDGMLVSRGSRTFDVTATDGGPWTSEYPVTMFLCPTAPGVNIVKEPLNMEVTVKSATGQFLGRASATSTIKCTGCEADCGG